MNATAVGKPIGMIHPLRNIRDITLEKNHMNVMNVEKLSAIIHHLVDTRRYTGGMLSKIMYENIQHENKAKSKSVILYFYISGF